MLGQHINTETPIIISLWRCRYCSTTIQKRQPSSVSGVADTVASSPIHIGTIRTYREYSYCLQRNKDISCRRVRCVVRRQREDREMVPSSNSSKSSNNSVVMTSLRSSTRLSSKIHTIFARNNNRINGGGGDGNNFVTTTSSSSLPGTIANTCK